MAFVIVAAQVAVAVGVVTSIYGQVQAGKSEQQELERAAEEEKIAAQTAELKRKQELNAIQADNIRQQAMAGTTGEGGEASLALTSAKQIGSSEAVLGLTTRLKQAQKKRQGKAANRAGKLGALSSAVNLAVGSGLMSAGSNTPAPISEGTPTPGNNPNG
tara:strand:+ start:326 stop:805 length:480 start_codon:yes stop_codon:yes gene_type:complete